MNKKRRKELGMAATSVAMLKDLLEELVDTELKRLEQETGVDLDAIADYGRGIERLRRKTGGAA